MSLTAPKRHPVFDGVLLGIGTWSWGDRLFWGFGHDYHEEDLRRVFAASLEAGINLFDTAEVYGMGKSESYLGQFMQEVDQPVRVATKFMPFPWRLSRRALLKALRKSLERLGRKSVDLYQIHVPMPPITVETWMEAMFDAYQAGLISGVGVSNYNRDQMQRAVDSLTRQGVELASNQVEYNLLNRAVEKNGMLKQCHELGITLIAYSPLALGLLTGKYTPENPPQGVRARRMSQKYLVQIQPLISLMRRIGADHAGKTPAQVAINWTICKGTLPIPGAKMLDQVDQNLGSLGWALTEDEVAELDNLSDRVTGDS